MARCTLRIIEKSWLGAVWRTHVRIMDSNGVSLTNEIERRDLVTGPLETRIE